MHKIGHICLLWIQVFSAFTLSSPPVMNLHIVYIFSGWIKICQHCQFNTHYQSPALWTSTLISGEVVSVTLNTLYTVTHTCRHTSMATCTCTRKETHSASQCTPGWCCTTGCSHSDPSREDHLSSACSAADLLCLFSDTAHSSTLRTHRTLTCHHLQLCWMLFEKWQSVQPRPDTRPCKLCPNAFAY